MESIFYCLNNISFSFFFFIQFFFCAVFIEWQWKQRIWKGYLFCPKWYIKMVRVWTTGQEPPRMKLGWVSPLGEGGWGGRKSDYCTYRHQDSFHFCKCFRRLIVSKRTQYHRANNSSYGVVLHAGFPWWTAHILCWSYHKPLQVNSVTCFLQVFRKKFLNVWVWINSYEGCSFRIKMEVLSRTDPYFQNIALHFFQMMAKFNKNLLFQRRHDSFH